MKWILGFQLFLFDFDGLLVNTEHIHYQAYVNALSKYQKKLPLSFANFCSLAHISSEAWKEAVLASIPDLDVDWKVLYQTKKEAYFELLSGGRVELMPGAERLLHALNAANIQRCVVTHSNLNQVQLIKNGIPILKTIEHWITREDYEKPKPHPECYLKAIALHGKLGDRIIGFEDSIRGLKALMQTPAMPVLVCPTHHPLLPMALKEGVLHFQSLEDVLI